MVIGDGEKCDGKKQRYAQRPQEEPTYGHIPEYTRDVSRERICWLFVKDAPDSFVRESC